MVRRRATWAAVGVPAQREVDFDNGFVAAIRAYWSMARPDRIFLFYAYDHGMTFARFNLAWVGSG